MLTFNTIFKMNNHVQTFQMFLMNAAKTCTKISDVYGVNAVKECVYHGSLYFFNGHDFDTTLRAILYK